MGLITVQDLEARLGRTLNPTEATQASTLIDDASFLVMDIAGTDFMVDGVLAVPGSVVPVVVAMVRRAMENPLGRTGENLGDFGWQQNAGGVTPATLFPTKREIRIVRRAVQKPRYGAVTLEGQLPYVRYPETDELPLN